MKLSRVERRAFRILIGSAVEDTESVSVAMFASKMKMTKRTVKAKSECSATRDLFVQLSEGMKALAEERIGKRTLRTHRRNGAGDRNQESQITMR